MSTLKHTNYKHGYNILTMLENHSRHYRYTYINIQLKKKTSLLMVNRIDKSTRIYRTIEHILHTFCLEMQECFASYVCESLCVCLHTDDLSHVYMYEVCVNIISFLLFFKNCFPPCIHLGWILKSEIIYKLIRR